MIMVKIFFKCLGVAESSVTRHGDRGLKRLVNPVLIHHDGSDHKDINTSENPSFLNIAMLTAFCSPILATYLDTESFVIPVNNIDINGRICYGIVFLNLKYF